MGLLFEKEECKFNKITAYRFYCQVFFLLNLAIWNTLTAQDHKNNEVINIGSRWELFVDSLLIDRFLNL